jgi:hypothetical protein
MSQFPCHICGTTPTKFLPCDSLEAFGFYACKKHYNDEARNAFLQEVKEKNAQPN